jgi:ADP-ribosylglycohydrolase
MNNPTDYCILGDRFNNGNGSLMRLAPIPIAFQRDVKKAV